MIPLTLRSIHGLGGSYLVGLKANQMNLHRQCVCLNLFKKPDYEKVDDKKKQHGRLQQRTYRCYSLASCRLAPRWNPTGLATLICVKRTRQQTGVLSEETAYFVSNIEPATQAQADELFGAIRQHWCVEVVHYKRDVSLNEDDLRTSKIEVNRLMSSLRTFVINLLERMNLKNMVAHVFKSCSSLTICKITTMKTVILLLSIISNLSISTISFSQEIDEQLIRRLEDAEREAILKSDTMQLTKLMSKNIVVQNPENAIVGFRQIMDRIKGGKINYSVFERRIDNIAFMNGIAVVMGLETLTPQGDTKNVGKTVKRRFTNVWTKENDVWKLTARQATIVSIN